MPEESSYYFLDEDEIAEALEAQGRTEENYFVGADVAERLGEISETYPNIDPGAALSLAKSGKGAADPVVNEASKRSPIGKGLRFTTRTLFSALATPLELVQGGLRALAASAYEAADEREPIYGIPSRFGANLWRAGAPTSFIALTDPNADLGEGFFPGGSAYKLHEQEARQLKIGGVTGDDKPITTGRLVASPLEQESTGHKLLSGLIDFNVALLGDPVNAGLGTVSKARQAKKAFQVFDSTPTFRKLAASTGLIDGTPRKTFLPELVDTWLKSKEGRTVIGKLAESDRFDDVWKGLGKKVDVDTARELTDAKTPEAVEAILKSKLGIQLREAPKFRSLDGFRGRKDRIRLLAQMPGEPIDPSDMDDAVEQLDRLQKSARLDPDIIAKNNEKLVRATGNIDAINTAAFETAEDIAAKLVGKGVSETRARQLTSFWPRNVREDVRYFVNAAGDDVQVVGTMIDEVGKALPTPHLFAEYAQTVPMLDVREIRRLTSKYPNLWTNPAVKMTGASAAWLTEKMWKPLVLLRGAYVSRVVGEEQARMAASDLDSAFRHPMSWISYVTGRKGATDILGQKFDRLDAASEFAKAHSRVRELQPAKYRKGAGMTLFRQGEEGFDLAWKEELDILARDPVTKTVAGKPLDEAKEWFWSGAGQKFRKQMSQAARRDPLLTRQGADAYIDSVVNRIAIKTGGNNDLAQAIASGKKLGAKELKEFADSAPPIVRGSRWERVADKDQVTRNLDNAVTALFNSLMSHPTNKLSRSVTFKQLYAKRIDELKAVGGLAAEEMDIIAKGFALDGTRKLLYDFGEKSQFFDITRAIFPFGEAWKEVLTRWAKIGTVQNPRVVRRFQQGLEGGRRSGFFYRDESSGEEMFAYPGAQQITEALLAGPTTALLGTPFKLGVPIKFEGRLSGLNIGAQAMPGFGPVFTFPVGAMLPDRPKYDDLREILLPFGEPSVKGGVLESQLPGWAKRFATALKNDEFGDRVYANSIGDVANYLYTTGKYDMNSVEGQQQLLADAQSKARGLYFIRALSQFVAPTGPQPKFLFENDGKMLTATYLAQDLRRMYEEDPDTAAQKFLTLYGEDAYLYLQPKSRELIPGVPVTKEGTDWVRSNPEIEKKFPTVYGLFAPEGGEFDFEAYSRYLETGAKERLLPQERLRLANHRRASMIYQEAKAKLPEYPTFDDREWLREIKRLLIEEYPGYDDTRVQKELGPQIAELKRAVKHPTIGGTQAGEATTLYLEARDKALKEAKARELASFSSAKGARDLRDWLRQIADALQDDYQGFGKVWDLVLSKELADDEPEVVEQEAAGF